MSYLPTIRETVDDFQLFTKKSLGQHFLFDTNLCDKIVRVALRIVGGNLDLDVIEVGPGPGGLTRSILNAGFRKLIAVEMDERAVRALQPVVSYYEPRIEILTGDARKVIAHELMDGKGVIMSNLPYNVGTELLINWLKEARYYRCMVLMFQKEVALRICAAQGGDNYGRLSVISNYICNCSYEFSVCASAFTPPPKVTSAIVSLKPKDDIDYDLIPFLEQICKVAFNQRRKMLRSSLKAINITSDDLSMLAIDSTKRAEDLLIDEYITLAKFIRFRK